VAAAAAFAAQAEHPGGKVEVTGSVGVGVVTVTGSTPWVVTGSVGVGSITGSVGVGTVVVTQSGMTVVGNTVTVTGSTPWVITGSVGVGTVQTSNTSVGGTSSLAPFSATLVAAISGANLQR
jgi:hypothetical protein